MDTGTGVSTRDVGTESISVTVVSVSCHSLISGGKYESYFNKIIAKIALTSARDSISPVPRLAGAIEASRGVGTDSVIVTVVSFGNAFINI